MGQLTDIMLAQQDYVEVFMPARVWRSQFEDVDADELGAVND